MTVRALIDRISDRLELPRRRAEHCEAAIAKANEARNAARHAAALIEGEDPRAARELRKAADRIGRAARGMWSL